jgi:hypothetical protein
MVAFRMRGKGFTVEELPGLAILAEFSKEKITKKRKC